MAACVVSSPINVCMDFSRVVPVARVVLSVDLPVVDVEPVAIGSVHSAARIPDNGVGCAFGASGQPADISPLHVHPTGFKLPRFPFQIHGL